MKRIKSIALAAVTCAVLSGATAYACHLEGEVTCPNGIPFKDVIVWVSGTSSEGAFEAYGVTDSEGHYIVYVGLVGTYTASLDPTTLPSDATIVSPGASVSFEIQDVNIDTPVINWVVNSPSLCESGGACWFTGGGAKIDQLIGIPVATKGNGKSPLHSFGGNVYPGCSPTAGDGGNWNHVARGGIKLHFKGTSIRVVKCGNVTPPPPEGSTSPVTPYNFIDFEGTGTLKGIQGNKDDFGTVTFFAHCEDRNEPGSKGARDGALIDRYYLRVMDGDGVVQLEVGSILDDGTIVPVTITDGNFQLHASSCDNPPF